MRGQGTSVDQAFVRNSTMNSNVYEIQNEGDGSIHRQITQGSQLDVPSEHRLFCDNSNQGFPGGRSDKQSLGYSHPASVQPLSFFSDAKAASAWNIATPACNAPVAPGSHLSLPDFGPPGLGRYSPTSKDTAQGTENYSMSSMASTAMRFNTDYQTQYQLYPPMQGRNQESPWATRQPCITDARSSTSGHVLTRSPSVNLNGNQQQSPGAIGSNAVHAGKRSPLPISQVFDHSPHAYNQVQVESRFNLTSDIKNPFIPSCADYFAAPLSTAQGRMSEQHTPPSNVRYLEDVEQNADHHEFNSASSPDSAHNSVGELLLSSYPDSSRPHIGRSVSAINGNFSSFKSTNREVPTMSLGAHSDVGMAALNTTSVYSGNGCHLPYAHEIPRMAPEVKPGVGSFSTIQPNSVMISDGMPSNAYADNKFLSSYFHTNGRTREPNEILEGSEWPSLSQYNQRHNQVASQERGDLRYNRSITQFGNNHNSREKTHLPPLNGIDHYQGSPQVVPRSRSSYNRNHHSPHSLQGYQGHYSQNRSSHQNIAPRCGESCNALKLELTDTHRRLQEAEQERDLYHRQYKESEQLRKLDEKRINEMFSNKLSPQMQRLSIESGPNSITDSPTSVVERLQRFRQKSSIGANSANGLPESHPSLKDDKYFRSELEILFADIKSWTGVYLKFPSSGKYSPELLEQLREVCECREFAESLVEHEKTKAVVVQALVSRFIKELLKPQFLESFKNYQDENEMSDNCQKRSDRFHKMLTPLLSRYNDPATVDASCRNFRVIIQHAARLSVAMSQAGGFQSWFIDFPRCGESFKMEFMEDAEKYSRNVSASALETEGSLVKLAATPLIARIRPGKPFSVISKATILVHSP